MAIINGTTGDDLLFASSSEGDVLTSDLGQDIFEISGIIIPNTPHIITDFDRLNDIIQVDLPAGSQTSDLKTAQAGNDATISIGDKQLAVVRNTLVDALNDIVITITDTPTPPNLNTPPTGSPTAKLNDALQNAVVNILAADLLAGFSDVDAGTILRVVDLVPSNGSVVNNDGNFTFTPGTNFNGVVNLTYGVSDGAATLGGQTLSFSILPSLTNIIKGTPGDDILLANSIDGNTLTSDVGQDIFEISGLIIPNTPHVITDFDQANDTIQVDLSPGSQTSDLSTIQSGNDAIINIGDKQLAIVQNTLVDALNDIVITITDNPTPPNLNTPPTGAPTTTLNNALQNTVVNILSADLLAGFSDVDTGTILTVTDLVTSNGSVANNDGNFTFTPDTNFSGVVNLTYGVNDGSTTLGGQTRSFSILPPVLTPVANNAGLIQISQGAGATTTLLFNKISHQANNRNELGVFAVDDSNGTVNGIAPGQSGYLTEVLKRSQVVFSSLSGNFIDTSLDSAATRTVDLAANSSFGFYLATNGTIDDSSNPANILFSFPSSNNSFQNAQITQPGGITQVAFEETSGGGDRDFNDLVFQVQAAPTGAPVGITQQGSREILDLTALNIDPTATFEIRRDADFNNHVGFYRIEDALGTVKVGTTLFKPGDSGYLEAVIQSRVTGIDLVGTNGQTITSNGSFEADALYAPVLIANASTANADFSNVYTAYSLGNADKADHIRLLGDNTFGFEDLAGGGDRDFNDIIVKATFPRS
jgi:hypothetical protein